jgi:hypothetical protein
MKIRKETRKFDELIMEKGGGGQRDESSAFFMGREGGD